MLKRALKADKAAPHDPAASLLLDDEPGAIQAAPESVKVAGTKALNAGFGVDEVLRAMAEAGAALEASEADALAAPTLSPGLAEALQVAAASRAPKAALASLQSLREAHDAQRAVRSDAAVACIRARLARDAIVLTADGATPFRRPPLKAEMPVECLEEALASIRSGGDPVAGAARWAQRREPKPDAPADLAIRALLRHAAPGAARADPSAALRARQSLGLALLADVDVDGAARKRTKTPPPPPAPPGTRRPKTPNAAARAIAREEEALQRLHEEHDRTIGPIEEPEEPVVKYKVSLERARGPRRKR